MLTFALTHASAWLCDPTLPSSFPPARCNDVALDRQAGVVGAAGGGFTSRADELRVQWCVRAGLACGSERAGASAP